MRTFVSLALLLLGLMFAAAAMAQHNFTALDQVKAYAAERDRKVSVRKWHGRYWVEVDGLDPHGVGKTVNEAAEDFLHCADMMDREPKHPTKRPAPEAPDCDAQNCS